MAMLYGRASYVGGPTVAFAAMVLPVLAGELEIEEPEVEKGEIELEYRGGWFTGRPAPAVAMQDEDEDDDGDRPGELENEVVRQSHEVEVEVGITEWLQFRPDWSSNNNATRPGRRSTA